MFPLFFLLGFKSMEEFMVAMGMTQNTVLQPMGLYTEINKDVIQELANFLRIFEGYNSKAYKVNGEAFYTIGYGTTNWLNSNGSVIRTVRAGDTITETDAYNQLLYFFNQNNFINKFNMHLKSASMALPRGLIVSLLNACYMGGLGLFNQNWFKMVMALSDKQTNLVTVSEIFKKYYISELKSYNKTAKSCPNSPTGKMYYCYGLGWSRRVFACCDAIQGIYKPKIWYDNNIKKAL